MAGALGRVEAKLEAAVAEGRHYEAQQMCLTLAARKQRRDPAAAREILERGALRLLAHGHAGEGADLGLELVKLLEVRPPCSSLHRGYEALPFDRVHRPLFKPPRPRPAPLRPPAPPAASAHGFPAQARTALVPSWPWP